MISDDKLVSPRNLKKCLKEAFYNLPDNDEFSEYDLNGLNNFGGSTEEEMEEFHEKMLLILDSLQLRFRRKRGQERHYFDDDYVASILGTLREYHIVIDSPNEKAAAFNSLSVEAFANLGNYAERVDEYYRVKINEIVSDPEMIEPLIAVIQRMA